MPEIIPESDIKNYCYSRRCQSQSCEYFRRCIVINGGIRFLPIGIFKREDMSTEKEKFEDQVIQIEIDIIKMEIDAKKKELELLKRKIARLQ